VHFAKESSIISIYIIIHVVYCSDSFIDHSVQKTCINSRLFIFATHCWGLNLKCVILFSNEIINKLYTFLVQKKFTQTEISLSLWKLYGLFWCWIYLISLCQVRILSLILLFTADANLQYCARPPELDEVVVFCCDDKGEYLFLFFRSAFSQKIELKLVIRIKQIRNYLEAITTDIWKIQSYVK